LLRQPLARRVGQFYRQPLLAQSPANLFHLQVDNLRHLDFGKRREGDDFVDTIQEFRAEGAFQRLFDLGCFLRDTFDSLLPLLLGLWVYLGLRWWRCAWPLHDLHVVAERVYFRQLHWWTAGTRERNMRSARVLAKLLQEAGPRFRMDASGGRKGWRGQWPSRP
jgi:hypothetical protein